MTNYRIVARGKTSADLYLYDDIGDGWFGGITAKQVIKDLAALGAVDTLNVRINSVGGSVFEGLAIYNALARNPATIIVHVDALAASIASIIAMAGSEIRIADNAHMMIHNAMGITMGTADEMRAYADTLDQINGSLVATYVKRTGQSEEQVRAWMDDETWLTAAQCVEYGFADSVTDEMKMAASGDLSRFHKVPKQLKAVAVDRPLAALRASRLAEIERRANTLASRQ
jgi:ATP-dependent Clp protease protease subunit